MAIETLIQLRLQRAGELGKVDQVSISGLGAPMPLIIIIISIIMIIIIVINVTTE